MSFFGGESVYKGKRRSFGILLRVLLHHWPSSDAASAHGAIYDIFDVWSNLPDLVPLRPKGMHTTLSRLPCIITLWPKRMLLFDRPQFNFIFRLVCVIKLILVYEIRHVIVLGRHVIKGALQIFLLTLRSRASVLLLLHHLYAFFV